MTAPMLEDTSREGFSSGSDSPGILARLFSVIYWVVFFFLSLFLLGLTIVVFALTFPFDPKGFLPHAIACFWGRMAFWMNPFWQLRVEGREKIERGKTYVLVANHLSHFDIMGVLGLCRHFKWIAKKEVLKIPIIGLGLRINRHVYVDRTNPSGRAKAYEDCRTWLQKGVSIFFFPEGTRSKTGDLQPFHTGAFRLTVEEKLPLVPIVITGTSNILKKNAFLLGQRALVRIRVLEPIPGGLYREDQVEEIKGVVFERMKKEIQS